MNPTDRDAGELGHVEWGVAPPPPPERVIHIVICRPGLPLQLGILGRQLVGVMMHWIPPEHPGGNRSVPHLRDTRACIGCSMGLRDLRWHGYLACWQPRVHRYVIADLSTTAVRCDPRLLPETCYDLRGHGLTLKRKGTAPGSRVIAELSANRFPPEDLREDFSVTAQLLRVWGHREDTPVAFGPAKEANGWHK